MHQLKALERTGKQLKKMVMPGLCRASTNFNKQM